MSSLLQDFLFTLVTCLAIVDTAQSFDTSELVVDMKYTMKKNLEITGLTQEEKDNLLHVHNAYRSLVRPYAANMVEMTWDDEIAAFAQEWANECTATHRPNRDLPPWINMGENLYWWYSGKYNEHKAAKFWWDEVQYYDYSTPSCQSGEVCGHYVTMVWAKSEKLGCGVARCPRLWDLPDYGRGAYYFVCSYSGRFVSRIKPYTGTDLPCSACYKTAFPKCRYNLCVSQDMIDNNIGYNGSTALTGLVRSQTITSSKSQSTSTIVTTTAETPSQTSTSPAITTETPSQTSTSPAITTETPSQTSTSPAITTETPSQTSTSPAITTETPSQTSTSPTITTETPSQASTSPAITTETPSQTSTSPTITTETPSQASTSPAITTETPSQTSTSPTITTETPSQTSSPAITTETPSQTSSPTTTTETPSQTSSPNITTATPSQTTSPTITTETPSQASTSPEIITETPSQTSTSQTFSMETPSETPASQTFSSTKTPSETSESSSSRTQANSSTTESQEGKQCCDTNNPFMRHLCRPV